MPAPKFILVPLDARPVCYDQVRDLAAIGGLDVAMPAPDVLGYLKRPADFAALDQWWRGQLSRWTDAPVILSLDTLAYGGLISSRTNTELLDALQKRVKDSLGLLRPTHRPRYGFSSVLRIPNYNNAEEEPDYWAEYGSMLYQFSVETHQQGNMPEHFFNQIPGKVIEDFMLRRQKNFYLNKTFLELLSNQTLNFLAYCQDDTGPQGFNVKEAIALTEKINDQCLQGNALVQTGADELALTLLSRALWANDTRPPKIYTWFFPDHGKKVMAKFDGLPVGNVVQRHVRTAGGTPCLSPAEADLILMVNAPEDTMGDHCGQPAPPRSPETVAAMTAALAEWIPKKPVAIADVTDANGSDNSLIRACLMQNIPLANLAGYAAWNTPGNSIGTAIAMGSVVVWARRNGSFNETALRSLLLKRFLDDWAYQANVRGHLRKSGAPPDAAVLNKAMAQAVTALLPRFRLPNAKPTFNFPCARYFEIAVAL